VFDFTLGNPYGEPPAALSAELGAPVRRSAARTAPVHAQRGGAGGAPGRGAVPLPHHGPAVHGGPSCDDRGRRGALNVALRAILSPGDEVVILAPYFVEYLFYIRNAGGSPVVAETDARFQLDLAAIEAALTPKTRAILVNTPNNRQAPSTRRETSPPSTGRWPPRRSDSGTRST